MSAPIRIGTRRSALATAQAGQVAAALRAQGLPAELVEITTEGDRSTAPLATIGGLGVFAGALREALLAGEIDLAVHSYKDLPTAAVDDLAIVCVPERADPRDVVITRDASRLGELPTGATVGTGSPRRAAQLLALRNDLDVRAVRGNVDTRIELVTSGKLDAVVLASAGLARLGRLDEVSEALSPDQMLPAPAQGALAVEAVSASLPEVLRSALAAIDDLATRAAAEAERAVLATLEAGCSAPLGALAEEDARTGSLRLRAAVFAADGSRVLRADGVGTVDAAGSLGARIAEQLLRDGAADLVARTPKDQRSNPKEEQW
jgi:hydroxymethylbilane synthase